MSDRKPTSVVLPAVVAVMVLLGAYVGAYYALVEPDASYRELPVIATYPRLITFEERDGVEYVARSYHYRWLPFFAPIHWLDRRIRPHVWEPKP